MPTEVLVLGNPQLRERSEAIIDFADKRAKEDFNNLKNALDRFRRENGFGRGIAGIQIGIKKRIIALNLGKESFIIVNPEIIRYGAETFTMWDDCMSFKDLLVRVKRFKSIDIMFSDESGERQEWSDIEQAIAELLQHEMDHLDGILAIDRAITPSDIIYKSEYTKNVDYYDKMVDYTIKSTL
jgi:peptide deformylase